MEHLELESTPTATNVERDVLNVDTALMALTSNEANDIFDDSEEPD